MTCTNVAGTHKLVIEGKIKTKFWNKFFFLFRLPFSVCSKCEAIKWLDLDWIPSRIDSKRKKIGISPTNQLASQLLLCDQDIWTNIIIFGWMIST